MKRRQFVKVSQGIAGLMILGAGKSSGMSFDSGSGVKVRFGLVTDLHYARKEKAGNRCYTHSIDKLREAMKVFNEQKPDFIIELGDFKDQGADREQTLAFLDEIETEYRMFRHPVYHVFGNHDMDNISKSDFLEHTANEGEAKGRNYYSFSVKGVKFIVLDANYNEDGSDYDSGNFDWKKAFIPKPQLDWLSREVETRRPVVVFLHQLLDLTQKKHGTCVGNAGGVIEILEKSGKVLAVFQGHHHAGSYSFSRGIHYFTMKGLIEGAFPENNSFALVEIDKELNITIDGFANCEDMYLKDGCSSITDRPGYI
ncbi:MAG: metallophosphoesterase [Dysgonamonadaceae bacterium]|jgi:alkaline phosphatase|nr:metallophosphoesterase [Dysgonamonadaceae bacterium]